MTDIYRKHDVFQAIADPTRREILSMLAEKEMSVTTISGYFSISRTAVTKHLHILEEASLVSERKVGRETRYMFQPEPMLELKKWLSYYDKFWDSKLAVLKKIVEEKETNN